jgi:hypothetical protein
MSWSTYCCFERGCAVTYNASLREYVNALYALYLTMRRFVNVHQVTMPVRECTVIYNAFVLECTATYNAGSEYTVIYIALVCECTVTYNASLGECTVTYNASAGERTVTYNTSVRECTVTYNASISERTTTVRYILYQCFSM